MSCSFLNSGTLIVIVGRGGTFYMCRAPFSVLTPGVHFGVHWVGECAGENQTILDQKIKYKFPAVNFYNFW
jgi:hypothetical protein